ncbi:Type IV pilus biogenesis protein PilC [Moritella viscosa]|uniref:Type IV pilus biogenesis protein PilC n=1 Tax=Moritella viscosa TaxID=80854 RepID=A0A090IHC7_9GAMM|nr:type II secretion system F family protein [Moritella viscosa]CED62050.1 type IV pilus assembly protein PilC [Moritella viscosa]SGY96430.1 Type IV pilus biogenesis protein PilC [Moritella viscosa]SGZ02023.1 Type IV pilus biogenesis protein PilC [Moritella viscosa]SHO06981.1 Type IV pilus biogenesis protein PilC [Moritella viscosa]SHO07115.1 Type IV pilus biogenesis protein PilC [Moritella viscosa]
MVAVTKKANRSTSTVKKRYPYNWQGVNRKGKKVSGEMQAESISNLKVELRRQGINVLKANRKSTGLFSKATAKIKPMDIALISRQISTMLSAGVPLVQSLEIIARSNDSPAMRALIGEVAAEVATGTPLSDALRKHPLYFDDLYCDLISAGEQSGSLDSIYDRIATYKEKAEALKSKIKKALFYPIMVVAVATVVTLVLLLYVIPQFKEIFAGFGAELPPFTLFVLSISDFVSQFWYLVIGILFGLPFAYLKANKRSIKVKHITERTILKIPAIGPIMHKGAMARFARTLSTTFAAGIPLVDSLTSAAGASGNIVYKNAVMDMRNEVIAGLQMHIAMRSTNLFPDMVTQMVMIGEESGSLDDMLAKVAHIYEQQVDDAVDGLTSLIEPMIMVVLGIIIGGLVIAMYLPIFKMGSIM